MKQTKDKPIVYFLGEAKLSENMNTAYLPAVVNHPVLGFEFNIRTSKVLSTASGTRGKLSVIETLNTRYMHVDYAPMATDVTLYQGTLQQLDMLLCNER